MATIEEEDHRFNQNAHSSISINPSKPNNKFISFFLQAVVMVLVVSLFFLFVGIVAVVLIHIFVAGRALRRRRMAHRWDPDGQFGRPRGSGLSPKDIQKLPFFDFAGSGTDSDCPVCLEGFKDGERCRLLPRCRHGFHARCVDTWLLKVSACPICRAAVPGFDSFDSDPGS